MPTLPKAHADGHVTFAILTPGPRLGFEGADHGFDFAERIGCRGVPIRVVDQRAFKKLLAREAACAPREGASVVAQAPARVEGAAEDVRFQPAPDCLQPKA